MKRIGIICEGPTDFAVLSGVIDKISGEENTYFQLQPEDDLTGKYGNGWKGVWKWCHDCASIREKLMRGVQPSLDFLVVQMDGDVSRKEKSTHCRCLATQCPHKEQWDPIECDVRPERKHLCPVVLPCADHAGSVEGYMSHLKGLITTWFGSADDVCVAIPCDSIEAWIVAAYDATEDCESIADPWRQVIAHGKFYHGIRIHAQKKSARVFEQFVPTVCKNWKQVTELCKSARDFEASIAKFLGSA